MSTFNFNAGPTALPEPVLQRMQQQLLDYQHTGMSLLEMSHRGKLYQQVHERAQQLFRQLAGLPDDFEILLLAGGATLQFAMLPLNFLPAGATAHFLLSGAWAEKAWQDAAAVGATALLFDGRQQGYSCLPKVEPQPPAGAAYLHLTSNETIDGLQWWCWPLRTEVPVFVDMSSDILSRPVDWQRVDLAYAGAQKNLGPAGVTVVVLRRSLLERCATNLPAYLSYRRHAGQHSLYNTPPVFAVQMLMLQMEWLAEQGGVAALATVNERKAHKLYQAIDASDGLYQNTIAEGFRSRMNVVFRLPEPELEQSFLQQAEQAGFVGLKGHRSKGGVRVSLYNAVSEASVDALLDFMQDFRAQCA